MIPRFSFTGNPLCLEHSEALFKLLMVSQKRPEIEVPFRNEPDCAAFFLSRVMAKRIEVYRS